MLACVLGCDQAFELGDIRVVDDGTILLRDAYDPFLQQNFGNLAGKSAPAFNPLSREFFAARRASFSATQSET